MVDTYTACGKRAFTARLQQSHSTVVSLNGTLISRDDTSLLSLNVLVNGAP